MQIRIFVLLAFTIAACMANFFLLGDETLLGYCNNSVGPNNNVGPFCHLFQAFYGHFANGQYVGFYYVAYGIFLGVFILYAYRTLQGQSIEKSRTRSAIRLLPMMPYLNVVISLVVAYVICLLIKFGTFDISVFDLKLSQYSSSGSIGFLLGFFIAVGVQKYLPMILSAGKSNQEPNNQPQ
ncbi:MAG: hypothetical protein P9F75_01135 [Candidatus Contendobacter sp.]|nr:hypothetical protein [Candidatus Contendobacter sp.]